MFANKPAIKKMSSTNAKAFNSLRQRVKKLQREDKVMEAGVAAAKEKMDSTDEDESSDSDSSDSDSGSDSDSEDEKAAEKKKSSKGKDKGGKDDDGFEVVGKKGQAEKRELDVMKAPKEQVTYEMVENKLKDIISSRGKKGTDRHENVEHLAYIATVAKCPAQEVEVLIMLISAQFDISGMAVYSHNTFSLNLRFDRGKYVLLIGCGR